MTATVYPIRILHVHANEGSVMPVRIIVVGMWAEGFSIVTSIILHLIILWCQSVCLPFHPSPTPPRCVPRPSDVHHLRSRECRSTTGQLCGRPCIVTICTYASHELLNSWAVMW